jgi:hypothetical protein
MTGSTALELPAGLQEEFATVAALWSSDASTRAVDAFLLSWVKYEKQLRRLFCFLIFQHPQFKGQTKDVIEILAARRDLYPETFLIGIDELAPEPVRKSLSSILVEFSPELERIQQHRHKLMHGQNTGMSLEAGALGQDIRLILRWVEALATEAQSAFGYDGLERNTCERAQVSPSVVAPKYPFSTLEKLDGWLSDLAKRKAQAARDKQQARRCSNP